MNYNLIKKKIKTLWEKHKSENDNSIVDSEGKVCKPAPSLQVLDNYKTDPIDKILLSSTGKYINEFLTLLENEIKNFYIFFHKIEKNLYVEINSHLYMEDNYK